MISSKYNLYNSLDFVLIGTGSASFLPQIQSYLLICNAWMKDNAAIYISYFNSNFLYKYMDRITMEQNFDFIPIDNRKRALASTANGIEMSDIYCEVHDCNEINNLVERYFYNYKMYSYPLASVLEGTHKSQLQKILRELDKKYSRPGFNADDFNNCMGYYVDGLFKKCKGKIIRSNEPKSFKLEKILFTHESVCRDKKLKTILLSESNSDCISVEGKFIPSEIYVVLLPSIKKLPETDSKEIILGNKTFRLLSIYEINALGLEYRNISPFLTIEKGSIKLNLNYDVLIEEKNTDVYFVGNGSDDYCYSIKKDELLNLLEEYSYCAIKL